MIDTDINFEINQLPGDSNILVKNQLEILAIVRTLIRKEFVVNAMFYPGDHILTTKALKIDEKTNQLIIGFDTSPNPKEKQQIVQSKLIIFTVRMQGVVIEFFAEQIESVLFEKNSTFRIAIPHVIIKFEHRDYHRVMIPKTVTTNAYIPSSTGEVIAVTLADISLTGMAIIIPASAALLIKAGDRFKRCTMELNVGDKIEFSLAITRVWKSTDETGSEKFIAGCLFTKLGANDDLKLSRYIQKIELQNMAIGTLH